MENSQIADVLDEIADLLELQDGNPFRVRSYRNAARTIRDHGERVEDMLRQQKDLTELPNVGDSTAEKVHQILETGTCEKLKALHEKLPEGLPLLLDVPGLGPKKAMRLYEELDVASIDGLKEACEAGRVRGLEGFGAKTEQNLLDGIEMLEKTAGRCLYRTAADQVRALQRHLEKVDVVQRWQVAGSFRRRKETIGDLDVLIEAGEREAAAEAILQYPSIESVGSRGREKVTVYLDSGLQVDFRFVEDESFGAALMYFTGSKAHNVAVRKRAVARDWKLNEYGLMEGDDIRAGRSEEEIYGELEMDWVPPELREDTGEVEAAAEGSLPELIELEEIRGDLQSHTTASDGAHSIEQMARAAEKMGYEYLALTDHSQAVSVANGLDEDRLKKHMEAIREVDANMDDFWLMAGIEVDILKDGQLDLTAGILEELDWVVGSIHYQLNLDEQAMTERIIRAVRSGLLHTLGHPTVRLIGQRDPITFDFGRIFEECAQNDVCMEINAQPDRLDLPDIYCRQAREAGVTLTMGTDAHQMEHLEFMSYGVNVARRGWLEGRDVLNTKNADELRAWLES